MTALGQRTLIQHLTDVDSLDTIAREGLDIECVPTEDLRSVVVWALNYFHTSGRTKAPSVGALRGDFGDLLDEHDIDLDGDPEDSIEWAIDDLKGSYVFKQSQDLNKRFAADMSEADTGDRVEVLAEYAAEMVTLSMRLESHETKVDAREGMAERLQAYHDRVAAGEVIHGLRLGIREIDEYTRGIHDGELAVVAAGPKVGKSYMMDRIALSEWRANRAAALYTLENSIEMTLDRIACMATGVDSRSWQHGECTESQIELVRGFVEEITAADSPLYVMQPDPGQRGIQEMVRQAQLLDVDSILIDQLTFVEPEDERAPRHIQIRQMTHDLKAMISTGRQRMPALVAHQINREGVKAADKAGYLEMFHLAEGSEVERTADWVFGLYRSEMERAAGQAKFQTLAARREEARNFLMTWQIDTGFIRVRSEIDREGNVIDRREGLARG
jgi:replicative DNA helicase